MITEAERVRAAPDPYQTAIARMAWRDAKHNSSLVVFHFEDGSTLTFKKEYKLENDQT